MIAVAREFVAHEIAIARRNVESIVWWMLIVWCVVLPLAWELGV